MTQPTLHFVTLDVFTTSAFKGNPLAVVFLSDNVPINQEQKQLIARQFNYSETIFIHPTAAGENANSSKRTIDIFTTHKELPFAGHPTIGATSWLLLHSKPEASAADAPTTITTKAGDIPISISSQDPNMVSALIPHNVRIHSTRLPLAALLRLHPTLQPYLDANDAAYSGGFPIVSVVKGMTAVHVRLPSLEALAAVQNANGGGRIPSVGKSRGGYLDDDFADSHVSAYFYVKDVWDEVKGRNVIRSRMFVHTIEDPATGSAASGLVAYLSLSGQGIAGGGKAVFDVVQGVEMGRRSDIGLQVQLKEGGREIDSIQLSGSAARVAEGDIVVQ
ncbi:hypothetical protein FQN50_008959 [Emmonsiellopsis sp. PD_5]|nr:hypothetical protein FQN50_008959 [Emmonsiellopsis sp. PD_5]